MKYVVPFWIEFYVDIYVEDICTLLISVKLYNKNPMIFLTVSFVLKYLVNLETVKWVYLVRLNDWNKNVHRWLPLCYTDSKMISHWG